MSGKEGAVKAGQPLGHPLYWESDETLESQLALKQTLEDFVLDAEGDVATALEAYTAEQLGRWAQPILSGMNRSELAVEMFLTEGKIADEAVSHHFVGAQPSLTSQEQAWLSRWQDSFNGLFVVQAVEERGYVLRNWLTEKLYTVQLAKREAADALSRLTPKDGPGEMLIARLLPISASVWTFSGPLTLLGKLGKPKLAVAIGNFRQWFPAHLYGDAPELEASAWESVAKRHQSFLDFFGAQKVTLSGYELGKKIQAYQAQETERQLAEAGIDSDKSLADIAKEAGLSDEELTEITDSMGDQGGVAKKLLESDQSLKMVTPKMSLPEELRRAKSVTVFVDPKWGQIFLTEYARLESLLAAAKAPEGGDATALAETLESVDRLVQKHLDNEKAVWPVWAQLAQDYGEPLESSLRRVLNQPGFDLNQDLEKAIARCGKSLKPSIPDSASVPEHLHNLFEEALQAVGMKAGEGGTLKKGKKKKKAPKKKSGFGG